MWIHLVSCNGAYITYTVLSYSLDFLNFQGQSNLSQVITELSVSWHGHTVRYTLGFGHLGTLFDFQFFILPR